MDVDVRLAAMDAAGIDVQLLSPNPITYFGQLDAGTPLAYARAHNDALAEMVARHPGRLLGAAQLPMQDLDAAIAELARAVRDLGLSAPYIDTDPGRTLDDPALDDLYAAVVELDVPLFVHPSPLGPRRAGRRPAAAPVRPRPAARLRLRRDPRRGGARLRRRAGAPPPAGRLPLPRRRGRAFVAGRFARAARRRGRGCPSSCRSTASTTTYAGCGSTPTCTARAPWPCSPARGHRPPRLRHQLRRVGRGGAHAVPRGAPWPRRCRPTPLGCCGWAPGADPARSSCDPLQALVAPAVHRYAAPVRCEPAASRGTRQRPRIRPAAERPRRDAASAAASPSA